MPSPLVASRGPLKDRWIRIDSNIGFHDAYSRRWEAGSTALKNFDGILCDTDTPVLTTEVIIMKFRLCLASTGPICSILYTNIKLIFCYISLSQCVMKLSAY